MALFRKQIKPKSFEIPTRYWDAEKEEREERERRIKAELGIKDESNKNRAYVPNIKGKFRSAAHGDRSELLDKKRKSQRRIFFYVAILFVVIYFLFSGLPFVEEILKKIAD